MEENKNVLVSAFGKQKRWVNWRYEKVGGKETKVPYQINGEKASSVDPSTWNTYEEVVKISPNVGIIFRPDQLLLGIDIDHCLENGKVVHEKHTEIGRFIFETDTYFEVSPSGTGIHGFLLLTRPLQLVKHKKAPFELYTSGRYFTVTNNPYGEVRPIKTVTPEDAVAYLSILGYPWNKEAAERNFSSNASLEDKEVLSKMFASKKGREIQLLYNGDISKYKSDDSSADMALCSHLAFWTGRNTTQIERIWLNSPLGAREKTRLRKDYRDRTINKAVEETNEVYLPKKHEDQEKVELPKRERIHKFEKPKLETSFEDWEKVINRNFPDLRIASEVAGSVLTQLLITDITNPSAVVFVDVPSSGKTIAINFFSDIPELAYPTDKFTPASFVSNSANVKKE